MIILFLEKVKIGAAQEEVFMIGEAPAIKKKNSC